MLLFFVTRAAFSTAFCQQTADFARVAGFTKCTQSEEFDLKRAPDCGMQVQIMRTDFVCADVKALEVLKAGFEVCS